MDEEILEKYRKAGKIASEARDLGAGLVKEGSRVLDVVSDIEALIIERGAFPAFPTNIAIDDVAAHFTPSSTEKMKFQRSQVVKIDVGVHVDGYVGDTARTVEVDTRNWDKLIEASSNALGVALEMIHPGLKLRTIGTSIERTIESFGYKSIINLTGHSLEQYNLHAGLSVPNVMDESTESIAKDMVLAIEPFATTGAGKVGGKKGGNIYRLVTDKEIGHKEADELREYIAERFTALPFTDRWCIDFDKKAKSHIQRLIRHGVVTTYPILRDVGRGIVSQREHSVVVTDSGCEILTKEI